MSIENCTSLRLMVFRIRELIPWFKCYIHHICRQVIVSWYYTFIGDTGYIEKTVGYKGLKRKTAENSFSLKLRHSEVDV